MSKKTTSILSYFTIIGWLIAYFAGARDEAKFYLNQSIVLALANVVVSIIARVADKSFILSIAVAIVEIVMFVFWIIGFVHACKQDDQEIPVIGSIRILK